jgi:hypothetical protein
VVPLSGRALVQACRAGDEVGAARTHHRARGHARPAQGALQRPHQAERHGHAHSLQTGLPQVPGRRSAGAVGAGAAMEQMMCWSGVAVGTSVRAAVQSGNFDQPQYSSRHDSEIRTTKKHHT